MPDYECKLCNYSTTRKSNFTKHCKTAKHLKNTECVHTQYECSICNFKTKDKTALRRHLLTNKHISNAKKTPQEQPEHTQSTNVVQNDDVNHNQTQLQQSSSVSVDALTKIIENQNTTLLSVIDKLGNTITHTSNNVNNNVNNFQNTYNMVTVNVLNDRFPDTPSLREYVNNALDDTETISLVRDGNKFHEIFDKRVIKPMRKLSHIERPLLFIKQRSRNHRKNIFVKTDNGWEDDTNQKSIIYDTIDNAAHNLHKIVRKKHKDGEFSPVSLEEYMDFVFNVREPLLTDCKEKSKSKVMKNLNDTLEVDKRDIFPN